MVTFEGGLSEAQRKVIDQARPMLSRDTAEATKKGGEKIVPMSDAAMAELQTLPRNPERATKEDKARVQSELATLNQEFDRLGAQMDALKEGEQTDVLPELVLAQKEEYQKLATARANLMFQMAPLEATLKQIDTALDQQSRATIPDTQIRVGKDFATNPRGRVSGGDSELPSSDFPESQPPKFTDSEQRAYNREEELLQLKSLIDEGKKLEEARDAIDDPVEWGKADQSLKANQKAVKKQRDILLEMTEKKNRQ